MGSLLMGVWANFPVAMAPGMGLNAFFAYYVCGTLGLHWTVALGAVFISGIVFLLLTMTNIRQMIVEAVPMNLKCSIVVGIGMFIAFGIGMFIAFGIGMFIAFVGLQNSGLVAPDKATLVSLGHLFSTDTRGYAPDGNQKV